MESKLFTPFQLGSITLRNRTIRSAAFENMCYNNKPSQDLFNYHTAVAQGGIGMTTIAYAAVNRSGLSFNGQLWMREEIVPELKKLTDAIHAQGAKASIQIGHCGNMTHFYTCGQMPVGASSGFNLYSPTFVRGLKISEIHQIAKDFGNATRLAKQAGFDCVEVHAGHGYLISQFISPYTNHRKDEFGGSLENRMRFMKMCINEVIQAANKEIAVVVKTNMYDGFKSGMQLPDCITVAKTIESLGVDAIVLSAGFVSKAPMAVMRGAMPLKTLAHYMNPWRFWWLKMGLALVGRKMIPTVPFQEAYFLEDALKFRKELKLPLIYVGGLVSRRKIDEVLNSGFELVQMARALVHDTQFVNKMQQADENYRNGCKHSNYCIARMYTLDMRCHHCVDNLPASLQKEIEKAEQQG
ncbi:MAG: NADH:flavin oxidoreductase [Bacteroidetes bacterium]|uniref:NADH:flavin oxidoreductase n=1 Tax=Candidatus Gallipaludibacter merdavium TaxID=2840839 RepID=A0A9D9HVH0_9BACT|nr:NADH:flavin oxidoreductase [Candidatus Gallipaludibacter merdavium]